MPSTELHFCLQNPWDALPGSSCSAGAWLLAAQVSGGYRGIRKPKVNPGLYAPQDTCSGVRGDPASSPTIKTWDLGVLRPTSPHSAPPGAMALQPPRITILRTPAELPRPGESPSGPRRGLRVRRLQGEVSSCASLQQTQGDSSTHSQDFDVLMRWGNVLFSWGGGLCLCLCLGGTGDPCSPPDLHARSGCRRERDCVVRGTEWASRVHTALLAGERLFRGEPAPRRGCA